MTTVTLIVDGMTCQGCTTSIQKTVGTLDGVHHVSVDLPTKKVTIEYDDDLLNQTQIAQAIEDAGFDVEF